MDKCQSFEQETSKTKVFIQLPKFKMEQKIDLKPIFIELGMSDMFSADLADFSDINGKKGLYVSEVVQKAFIEVRKAVRLLLLLELSSKEEALKADPNSLLLITHSSFVSGTRPLACCSSRAGWSIQRIRINVFAN